MFTGKIRGLQIAEELGASSITIPEDLGEKAEILKSPGGMTYPYDPSSSRSGVFPVLHCMQEIPCNPCMTCCPLDLIGTEGHPIMGIPVYSEGCVGCEKCVAVCPGLAVTLVDFRKSEESPLVTVPFELGDWLLSEGEEMTLTDWEGVVLGTGKVVSWRTTKDYPSTTLLKLLVPADVASRVAGVRIQDPQAIRPLSEPRETGIPDDAVICRCERVTAGDLRKHIRAGIRDLNHLKALTRAGFGACGGKTCSSLLSRLLREEGVGEDEVTPLTDRPLFAETQLGWFSGKEDRDE